MKVDLSYKKIICDHIEETIQTKDKIMEDVNILNSVSHAAVTIADAITKGNRIFIAGNGGSASDAQHISAEFIGRLVSDRRPLPSISLNTDTSAITAIANDYGYDQLFSRQIKGLGCAGDILIGISTSGTSQNILNAFDESSKIGIYNIFLTSDNYKADVRNVDLTVSVPSTQTMFIQESHIMIGHIICKLVENELFDIENWVK
jgi:D-sedoheptulose 7-phosphate isomerase